MNEATALLICRQPSLIESCQGVVRPATVWAGSFNVAQRSSPQAARPAVKFRATVAQLLDTFRRWAAAVRTPERNCLRPIPVERGSEIVAIS
jgi:hypothetical protein